LLFQQNRCTKYPCFLLVGCLGQEVQKKIVGRYYKAGQNYNVGHNRTSNSKPKFIIKNLLNNEFHFDQPNLRRKLLCFFLIKNEKILDSIYTHSSKNKIQKCNQPFSAGFFFVHPFVFHIMSLLLSHI